MRREIKFLTKKEDYKRIGIELSDQQYEDLQEINLLMQLDENSHTPIHYILMVLQILGILPSKDVENKFNRDFSE